MLPCLSATEGPIAVVSELLNEFFSVQVVPPSAETNRLRKESELEAASDAAAKVFVLESYASEVTTLLELATSPTAAIFTTGFHAYCARFQERNRSCVSLWSPSPFGSSQMKMKAGSPFPSNAKEALNP